MFLLNSTGCIFSTFLVTGIPGLEAAHTWMSIPFCFTFLITLVGNVTIMTVIWCEQSLHMPMSLFLAMLAASDLGLSLFTFPTLLRIFWLNARELTFPACFTQMSFIHTFQDFESAVILAMAFDRYVAISRPLHYSSILTNTVIIKIGLTIVFRTLTVQVPLPILLRRLCFCRSNVLSHSYCLHPDIIKLSCSDTRVNSVFGLFVVLSTMGLDFLLIVFSYVLILNTVLRMASHGGRLKALNTCISHLCAVFLFFTPMICLSMLHRFGPRLPSHVYVTMANMHFLLPPVMNPIVYVVKTKQIRDKITKLFITNGLGHAHISERKHGQEVVHGLVQPGVPADNMQDEAVAHDSYKVEETERDGNPVVKIFIARNTCEVERGGQGAAAAVGRVAYLRLGRKGGEEEVTGRLGSTALEKINEVKMMGKRLRLEAKRESGESAPHVPKEGRSRLELQWEQTRNSGSLRKLKGREPSECEVPELQISASCGREMAGMGHTHQRQPQLQVGLVREAMWRGIDHVEVQQIHDDRKSSGTLGPAPSSGSLSPRDKGSRTASGPVRKIPVKRGAAAMEGREGVEPRPKRIRTSKTAPRRRHSANHRESPVSADGLLSGREIHVESAVQDDGEEAEKGSAEPLAQQEGSGAPAPEPTEGLDREFRRLNKRFEIRRWIVRTENGEVIEEELVEATGEDAADCETVIAEIGLLLLTYFILLAILYYFFGPGDWTFLPHCPIMPFTNGTCFQPSVLKLIGIPGLEAVQHWIGIPFFLSFVLAAVGNGLLVTVIRSEPSLHEPMYVFLAVLATTDLGLTICITPKMLAIFWLQSREILFDSCLVQMYFTHTFQCMESGILLAMAFDRYVAICQPLRHSAILTRKVLVGITTAVTIRASVIIIMCPLLIKLRLRHFRTTVISHSYCEHMAVVKLAADNVSANKAYGLFVAFSVLGFDVIFIFLSYAFIFQAVFKLPQKEARFKAFNTCTAHIFVFLQFYILTFFTSFIHRFGFSVAPYVHILLSNLYLLLPPLLNPIVYGVKTKQIRDGVVRMVTPKQ
ncbi:uncharacterized protein ACOB6Z_010696 [Ctenodactylus gundi]